MDDLAPSTVNVRRSAVRNLVGEAERLAVAEEAEATDVPIIRQQGARRRLAPGSKEGSVGRADRSP